MTTLTPATPAYGTGPSPSTEPRCGERNAHGGTRCRNFLGRMAPLGACHLHREQQLFRAEVSVWVDWIAHSLGLGADDAECALGSAAGVSGDLCNWTPEELRRALDTAVGLLAWPCR